MLKKRGVYALEIFKCPLAIRLTNVLFCQMSNMYDNIFITFNNIDFVLKIYCLFVTEIYSWEKCLFILKDENTKP